TPPTGSPQRPTLGYNDRKSPTAPARHRHPRRVCQRVSDPYGGSRSPTPARYTLALYESSPPPCHRFSTSWANGSRAVLVRLARPLNPEHAEGGTQPISCPGNPCVDESRLPTLRGRLGSSPAAGSAASVEAR